MLAAILEREAVAAEEARRAEEERLARIAAATADKEEDFEWKPTSDGKGVVITGLNLGGVAKRIKRVGTLNGMYAAT